MGGGHTRIQVHKRHATRRALENHVKTWPLLWLSLLRSLLDGAFLLSRNVNVPFFACRLPLGMRSKFFVPPLGVCVTAPRRPEDGPKTVPG